MRYQIEMKCGHSEEIETNKDHHESIPIKHANHACKDCTREGILVRYSQSLRGERAA